MKTKIFKLICVLFSLALILLGCSSKKEEIPTLKMITIGGGKPKNYDMWKEKVDEYLVDKIGAKIDVEVISWGDWETRRNVIATSNEYFDILFGNLNTYNQDVQTGLFEPLDDMLKTDKFKPLYSMIPEKYWDGVKVNGLIYSVLTYKDSSATQYFVIDKSLLEKYNFDITNRHELPDYDEFLIKVYKDTNKPSFILTQQGADQIFYDYDRFSLPFNVLGVKATDQDMKVVNMLEQDEIMKDLEYLHKWYKMGVINQDAATTTEAPKYKPFNILQGWPLAKISWGQLIGTEVEISKYRDSILSNGTVQGSINGISASSNYKEKALEFLQLLNTDTKLRDMFAYGVEGYNFSYVEKYGETRVHKNLENEWTMPAYAQATFFTMTITDDTKENQWLEVEELNNIAIPSVLLGFSFDTENVEDEIANVLAIYIKYRSELLTGVHEPHQKVKEMIDEMNKVGLEKIKEEAQRQINEFKKNKK